MKTTGDLQLLKRINRSVLLRLVRSQPGLSRAQLASLSGLTKSTVSALVRELIDEHWLSEAASQVVAQRIGRPSTPLNLATHKRVLLGLEIAVDCLRLVAVSLSGVVLGQSDIALDDRRPANACQLAVTLLGQQLRQLEQQQLLLSGVGVCLPGAIDGATGMVRLAPNLGWRDVPFLEMLTAECASRGITRSEGAGARSEGVGVRSEGVGVRSEGAGVRSEGAGVRSEGAGVRSEMLAAECASRGITAVPIHLQNDADSAAVGEYEFGSSSSSSSGDTGGSSSGADPLIFVNCDVGVGAGIVLNDRLYTGYVGSAGEIGHSILQVNGPLCSCGRRGCAEAFVGARALQQPGGAQQAGHYLGMVLQNLDAMFNPRIIVLGGRSAMENPALVEAARLAQQAYAQSAGMQAPVVRVARFGLQAAAVGAAALVLHQFLRPLLKETNHVPGH